MPIWGGAYTVLWGSNAPQDFEVVDGTGLIYHQGSYGREALLEQVAPLNADLRLRVKMNSRPQKKRDIYLMARRIDQKNLYRARVGVKPNGQVELHLQRQVNGAWSVFTTSAIAPNVTHTAGDYLWVRFQVVGTNPTMLQLRVWEDGQPEPTAWHLTVFDSSPALQSAGTVGVRTYITTDDIYLPVKFFFDDLWITAPGPLVTSALAWPSDSPVRSFYADELMAEGLDVVFLPLIRNQPSE